MVNRDGWSWGKTWLSRACTMLQTMSHLNPFDFCTNSSVIIQILKKGSYDNQNASNIKHVTRQDLSAICVCDVASTYNEVSGRGRTWTGRRNYGQILSVEPPKAVISQPAISSVLFVLCLHVLPLYIVLCKQIIEGHPPLKGSA